MKGYYFPVPGARLFELKVSFNICSSWSLSTDVVLELQYADPMKNFYLKLSLYKSVAGQPSKGFDGNENIFTTSLSPIVVKLRSVFLEWKSVVETM